MTNRKRLFYNDQDSDDSVATDDTAPSEPRDEYPVERILSEYQIKVGPEKGITKYLIKWETYRLHRATWEPEENINSATLDDWRDRQKRVREGLEQPFEVDDWQRAVESETQRKRNLHIRRKAKRRARGISVSASDEERDHNVQPEASSKKKVRYTPVQRKGVAQKVKRRRAVSDMTSSSDSDSSQRTDDDTDADALVKECQQKVQQERRNNSIAGDNDSDVDSLFDDPEEKLHPKAKPKSSIQKSPAKTQTLKQSPHSHACPDEARVAPTGPSEPKRALSGEVPKYPLLTAKRSAAPNIFSNNSAKGILKRKQREHVSGETPKDSQGKQFTHLGIQHIYRKYAVNERYAPDPKELSFVDLKTGKVKPPEVQPPEIQPQEPDSVASEEARQEPQEQNPIAVPTTYHRRTPPPGLMQKSPTPPPSPVKFHGRAGGRASITERRVPPKRTVTCRHWLEGNCHHMLRPEDCGFAHYHIEITCTFWLRGHCWKADDECEYAHFDTGSYHHSSERTNMHDRHPPRLPAKQRGHPVQSSDHRLPKHLVTCTYWLSGFCHKPDNVCDFAHHDTGNYHSNSGRRSAVESNQPSLPPRQRDSASRGSHPASDLPKYKTTCPDWLNHRCLKADAECDFAHYKTDHHSPLPLRDRLNVFAPPKEIAAEPQDSVRFQPSVTFAQAVDPLPVRHVPRLSPSPPPPIPEQQGLLGKKKWTCHFWRVQGDCCKNESCVFSHFDTGLYAPAPPGYVKKAKKRDIGTMDANTIPLADTSLASQPLGAPENADSSTLPLIQTHISSPASLSASPFRITNSPTAPQVPATPSDFNFHGATTQRCLSVATAIKKATLKLRGQENSHSSPLDVEVEVPDPESYTRLGGINPLILHVTQMVMANDFEEFSHQEGLHDIEFAVGGIIAGSSQTLVATKLAEMAEMCRLRNIGLIAKVEDRESAMLIYPSMLESFKFLGNDSSMVSSRSILRFRLYEKIPRFSFGSDEVALPAVSVQASSMAVLGQQLLRLDEETFFPAKEAIKGHRRSVFLIFPGDHRAELEVYTQYFQGLDSEVYHSDQVGAWDYFRKSKKSCVVIVHPGVPLSRIQGLANFVAMHGAGVRVFSIGIDRLAALSDDREPSFGCVRLFPHGMVIFITDDVLLNYPDRTARIVEAVVRTQKIAPEGGFFKRIATRPGIKSWLLEVARTRVDTRLERLNKAFADLCPDEAEDPWNDGNPLPSSLLVSISPDLLPCLRDKNQADSVDYMVNWFAGWSILNASRYRDFVVCHEAEVREKGMYVSKADTKEWAKQHQHIRVLLPEEVLARLGAPRG